MSHSGKGILWFVLGLAIFLALIWQFYPLPDAKKRLDNFPLYGPAFEGKKLEKDAFEKSYFKDVTVLKRLYNVEGTNYFVTVIDGSNNRHVVHDPYYCFKGGGWDITGAKEITIPGGNAMLVNLRRGDETTEALYWFTDENKRYSSALEYWMQATFRRLSLGFSGPEPVLVTILPIAKKTIDLPNLEKNFPEIFQL